jgi:SAM-dependent methyltransferase
MKLRRISSMSTKPIAFYRGIRIKADTGLHTQIVKIVESRVRTPARILDYGCGAGALSQRLADDGYDVVGVDIDQASFEASTPFEQLDLNSARDTARFERRNAGQFDLVLAVEVIEHVENPWEFVRGLRKLVRPGGYILVSTPNVTSWFSRVSFLRTGRLHQFDDGDREYGHINPIAEDELRLIASRCGLDTVELIPGGWLPRLWISQSMKQTIWNVLGFLGTFRMRGIWDGWCLIATFRRPISG